MLAFLLALAGPAAFLLPPHDTTARRRARPGAGVSLTATAIAAGRDLALAVAA